MTWEYLEDEQFDRRIKVVADYLKGKTKDKTILDLDCGSARLLNYIKNDFKEYIGNDILDMFPRGEKRIFHKITDKEMAEKIGKTDIMVVFGVGGYEISHEPVESPTISDSIIKIAEKVKPKIIVIESVVKYQPILISIIARLKGYITKKSIHIEPFKNDWVADRHVFILEFDK